MIYPTHKKVKRCFHLRQKPCSSGIKGVGKKFVFHSLYQSGPSRCKYSLCAWKKRLLFYGDTYLDRGDQLPDNPRKVKAKKPCLHPLYPMNKTFAEGESNEKGFYYVGRDTSYIKLTSIIFFLQFKP
jgi:hypothetical protein